MGLPQADALELAIEMKNEETAKTLLGIKSEGYWNTYGPAHYLVYSIKWLSWSRLRNLKEDSNSAR